MTKNFEITKNIIKSLSLVKGIYIREVENILPNHIEQTIKIDCRIPKKRKMEILEFREALYDQLSEQISCEYATEYINNNFTILEGLGEGDQFKDLEVYTLNDEKIELKHESGKIWLLDFWATWCQYCQEPMEDNMKISKNLNKDVKIIGLSVEEDRGKWKQHVFDKHWDSIEQYVRPGLLQFLGLKTIPDIAILDRNGKIIYLGHPNHIKVEETLNSLAEGKGIIYPENLNPGWNDRDIESKAIAAKEIADALKEKGANNVTFYINTKSTATVDDSVCKTSIIFKGQVTPYENEIVRKLDLKGLKEPVYNFTVLSLCDEDF
jgi:thiol-disulfide isomerase/thioredoxin